MLGVTAVLLLVAAPLAAQPPQSPFIRVTTCARTDCVEGFDAVKDYERFIRPARSLSRQPDSARVEGIAIRADTAWVTMWHSRSEGDEIRLQRRRADGQWLAVRRERPLAR